MNQSIVRAFVLMARMRQCFGRLFAPLSRVESGAYRERDKLNRPLRK